MRQELRVGGLVPLTTTDYPGRLAAVVFCQGCPWRCSYCHNPHLIPPRGAAEIAWPDVIAFLERRRGLLDAVVFSGGEPTLQAGIVAAARTVRAMGFKTGLHTAGAYPRRLARLLPHLDWVGLDVKAPFNAYAATTGVPGSGANARASLDLVIASGIDYECRTTVDPALLDPGALEQLAESLAQRGVTRYAVQACRDQRARARIDEERSFLEPAYCGRISRRFASFELRAGGAHPEH